MSMKSDIYANYVAKIDAHNATIGGEPVINSFPKESELAVIRAGTTVYGGPRSSKAYLQPDGTVIEICQSIGGVGFRTFWCRTYKDERHFRGYRETMGPTQYFEG